MRNHLKTIHGLDQLFSWLKGEIKDSKDPLMLNWLCFQGCNILLKVVSHYMAFIYDTWCASTGLDGIVTHQMWTINGNEFHLK